MVQRLAVQLKNHGPPLVSHTILQHSLTTCIGIHVLRKTLTTCIGIHAQDVILIYMPLGEGGELDECLQDEIWVRAARWAHLQLDAPETIYQFPAMQLFTSTPPWVLTCVRRIVEREGPVTRVVPQILENGN